jgi:hypothetical protein
MNGIVYILRRDDRMCKIGYTRRGRRRLNELIGEYGHLWIVHQIPTSSPEDLERYLHKEYAHRRDGNTEWFSLTEGDIQRIKMIQVHVHRVTFWEALKGVLRWGWRI